MFEPTSRYYALETVQMTTSDGRGIAFKRRRFLPQGDALPLLASAPIGSGERLDLFTARTLGDPEQFWRICDANNAMRPTELTDEPGRVLRVPVPQPV